MRAAFDKLISWTGVALAVVLLVAGSLLMWAHAFIGNQVHDQLVMQDITMPSGAALSSLPKADADALKPYAGSTLDTGPEAKAFANHYIQVHLNEAAQGKTYNDISGEYVAMTDAQKAAPAGVQLGQLRQTLFMGDTLRGLLLYGYAFATIGTIVGIAAWFSFGAAAILLVLFALGLWHARRVDQPAVGRTAPARVAQPA
jgi:hypothetical protein